MVSVTKVHVAVQVPMHVPMHVPMQGRRRPRWRVVVANCGSVLALVVGASTLHAQQRAGARTGSTRAKASSPSTDSAKASAAVPDTVHHFSGVIGVATDSLHQAGHGLAGAVVTVVGTSRHGTTDSAGQFR